MKVGYIQPVRSRWVIFVERNYYSGAKMVLREATHRETLIYIEQMLEELSKMAKQTSHPLLAYMIDMALQEARDTLDAQVEN